MRCWKVQKCYIVDIAAEMNCCREHKINNILEYDARYYLMLFEGFYPWLESKLVDKYPGINDTHITDVLETRADFIELKENVKKLMATREETKSFLAAKKKLKFFSEKGYILDLPEDGFE